MPKTESFKTDTARVRWYNTAAGGKRYMATWRDSNGAERSKSGFATKKAARDHTRVMEGVKAEGRETLEADTTLSEFWAKWWPVHKASGISKSHIVGTEIRWRLNIQPAIGHKRLVDIRPLDVRAILAAMNEDDYSVSAMKKTRSLTSQLFLAAIEDTAGLHANPVTRTVKVPKRQERTFNALTVAQVDKLIEVAPAEYKPIIRLLAFAGLRPGEAEALRRDVLDLDAETVTLCRSGRNGDERDSTKTYKNRTIKLQPDILAELTPRAEAMLPTAWLYPTFSLPNFWYWLCEKKKGQSGISLAGLPEWVTPYTLRHTCATILADAGVKSHVAAKFMGHHPVEFLRTYAEVFDDKVTDAADAITMARGLTPTSTHLRVVGEASEFVTEVVTPH